MKSPKLKIFICFIWISFVSLICSQNFWIVTGQIAKKNEETKIKPTTLQLEKFNSIIQSRFLTEPFFGARRIQPLYPTNPHLSESFYTKTQDEENFISEFDEQNWKVSIHLFGRIVQPILIEDSKPTKFSINYRLSPPIPVTKNLYKKRLPKPETLLKDAKKAFIEFQTLDENSAINYEFEKNGWNYYAKPVRAADESCVKCHTDYVILNKKDDKNYVFKKRQVGDVNGILIYGFKQP
ncbi:MAG: DUF3365 domain-containing protein [Pyrinomonadaceae bacterium]|jgi:hypothetical protein|nr:DUF3365 domain-containing protein [Pyrinomonadaceae bacterium]